LNDSNEVPRAYSHKWSTRAPRYHAAAAPCSWKEGKAHGSQGFLGPRSSAAAPNCQQPSPAICVLDLRAPPWAKRACAGRKTRVHAGSHFEQDFCQFPLRRPVPNTPHLEVGAPRLRGPLTPRDGKRRQRLGRFPANTAEDAGREASLSSSGGGPAPYRPSWPAYSGLLLLPPAGFVEAVVSLPEIKLPRNHSNRRVPLTANWHVPKFQFSVHFESAEKTPKDPVGGRVLPGLRRAGEGKDGKKGPFERSGLSLSVA